MISKTYAKLYAKLLVIGAVVLCNSCAYFKDHQHILPPNMVGQEIDLSSFFRGIDLGDATFVAFNATTQKMIRYNSKRAQRRFIPASTFKIANSLIAIETNVVDGPDYLIRWNGKIPENASFWAPAWSQDHTLQSAMKHSTYWYYQEIARQIGTQRMQKYLRRFNFGNQSIKGGIDQFWLHGDLRISPNEQVRFLAKMYYSHLGLSDRATEIVKDVIVLKQTETYRLSGKTGTADLTPTRELLWLVGYIEQDDDVWFYALNMEGENAWEQWGSPSARIKLVLTLLREVDIIK